MIFVTLGSQKFQFDRLLKALDELADQGKLGEEILAQSGVSTYQPKNFPCEPFMDPERFSECVARADIVIAHAGTGTVIRAVNAGKKVIVVPRLARYGEHVDDHQTEMAEVFSQKGMILTCTDCGELEDRIREARGMVFNRYESNTERYIRDLDEYLSPICGTGNS